MAHRFVPQAAEICDNTLRKFVSLVGSVEKLLVITGAGISTESGIPDYRSKDVGLYSKTSHKPILYQDFMNSKECRQQYWSRNFFTWPTFGKANPNINHYLLAKWESWNRFLWLVTQNIDGLHREAGSSMLSELHGNTQNVICTTCDYTESRQSYQQKLNKANPGFGDLQEITSPDESLTFPLEIIKNFHVPDCSCCGGILKTAVTFFGENVDLDELKFCHEKVKECDGVLALGTSLTVSSGFQFVNHAILREKPIFIVNIGPTRADEMATLKLDYKISDVLKEM